MDDRDTRRRSPRFLVGNVTHSLILSLCIAASFSATREPRASFCDGPESPLSPSRDLYCIELVRAVGVRSGAGRVELGRAAGPFTVDASADGHLRYTPGGDAQWPPAPRIARALCGFVAWVASPTMDVVQRLGVVDNGRTVLPAISLDKFIVLVTAEASASATGMRGRLMLRGMSPSTRLQPPDFMQFLIGATREDSAPHEHHEHGGMDSLGWTMVPMPAGISMLPAEMTLRPNAAPYLPRPANPDSLPLARPRTLVRLTSGDTLRLTAGIVRRPFKGRTLTMFAFNGQYPGPLLQVAQGADDHGRAHERARSADDGALARRPPRQRESMACPT